MLRDDHECQIPEQVRGPAQGGLSRVESSPGAQPHATHETSCVTVPAMEYRIVADGVQVLADDPGA